MTPLHTIRQGVYRGYCVPCDLLHVIILYYVRRAVFRQFSRNLLCKPIELLYFLRVPSPTFLIEYNSSGILFIFTFYNVYPILLIPIRIPDQRLKKMCINSSRVTNFKNTVNRVRRILSCTRAACLYQENSSWINLTYLSQRYRGDTTWGVD